MPQRGDDRDDSLLARYLGEIDAHAPLSDGEEEALGHALRSNSYETQAARRRLIQAHLRLVADVATRRNADPGIVLDLIHEGNLGLLRAVERFDPERGSSFAAYATWWIRRAIARAFDETTRGLRRPEHASWAEAATSDNISFALLDRLAAPGATDPASDEDDTGPHDLTAAALERSATEAQLALLRPDERQLVRARFGWIEAASPPSALTPPTGVAAATDPLDIEAIGMSKLRHPSTALAWRQPAR